MPPVRLLPVLLLLSACRCGAPPPASPPVEAGLVETRLVAPAVAGCIPCANDLRVAVRSQPGIDHVDIILGSGKVVVRHDPALVSSADLAMAASGSGYEAKVLGPDDPDPPTVAWPPGEGPDGPEKTDGPGGARPPADTDEG